MSSRARPLEFGRLVGAGVLGAGGANIFVCGGRDVALAKNGGGRPANRAPMTPSSSSSFCESG